MYDENRYDNLAGKAQEEEVRGSLRQAEPEVAAMPQARQTAEAAPPTKKKTNPMVKILGLTCSGLLFGAMAGLAVVIILSLFPIKSLQAPKPAAEEPSAPIEKTEQVSPDQAQSEPAPPPKKPQETEPQENKPVSDPSAYTQEGGIDATTTTDSSADTTEMAVVTDVTKVVDSVMPSVVSIFGTYVITENYWGYQFSKNEEGSGSGFIVGQNDEELLLVTNNHVVADASSLTVQFIDDTTVQAVVKGTNADKDLAIIAVRMSDLAASTKEAIKIATLGDSDKLKVGEPAIAIGNALGYGQSVTTGVISAVNRDYSVDENGNSQMLIQTDAAINPGNSGGALLNVYGEVIGINSSKLAGSTIEGMGYAIPISTAKPIIEELMNKKTRLPVNENKKGYLGISGINVTQEVHEMYDLPIGVYIAQVFDGTAAEKAGIQKGDIITSIDGEKVETMEELSAMLDCLEAGTEVEIELMSAGTNDYYQKLITVVLGARTP